MSPVQHGAVAPPPSELSFEGLTKRLLALRGEIDSILTELAKTSTPTVAGAGRAHLEIDEQTLIEVCAAEPLHESATDSLTDSESAAGAHVTTEAANVSPEPTALADEVKLSQTSAPTVAAAPEQPASAPADEEPIEVAQEEHESAAIPGDDLAPVVAADASPGDCLDGTGPCLEAKAPSIADAASSGLDIQAQQHPAIEPSHIAVDPPTIAANASAQPVDAAAEAPIADATVLSLDAHRRRQKREPAAAIATPVRKRPRIAGRIAACILVLLTAAAALLTADRTALGNVLGSVQSLPWVSELSSYLPNAADWPFLRERRAARQISDGMTLGEISASEDAVLAHYREVWPNGS
jgi:hypothetical protein